MHYRVKEFREEQKMSQTELAEKANVSRAIISRLESDEKDIVTTTETLQKIAEALDKKVSDIFFE